MRLVKLTGLPTPGINDGRAEPCFVDADRVIYIERSELARVNQKALEAHRSAIKSLYDEVGRIGDVVKNIRVEVVKLETDNPAVHRRWHEISQASEELNLAYRLVNATDEPPYHPSVQCTTVGLAYGDGGGNRIALFHVMESPDEVARILGNADPAPG